MWKALLDTDVRVYLVVFILITLSFNVGAALAVRYYIRSDKLMQAHNKKCWERNNELLDTCGKWLQETRAFYMDLCNKEQP